MGAVLLSPSLIAAGPGIQAQTVPAPTVSTISASGAQVYQLTCAVSGPALTGVIGPTGTVTFTDITAGQTLGTATLSSTATSSIYGPPQIFPAGNLPVSIAAGDFNGDGKLDAVFGSSDGSVSLLLGNGDGTFQAPVTITTPARLSFSMVSGDFNGDGKLDLAVADWESDNIYVLLGNGDGTFQTPQPYPNSAGPYGEMIAADVNGDGNLDLVVTNFNDNEISVLLGNGDGTLQPAIITQTDLFPGGVAAADLNGDGKLDLVVVSAPGVSIFLGNGDGTFRTPTDYPVEMGAAPEGVAITHFTSGKTSDIAVTSTGGTFVLMGNGDGTFRGPYLVSFDYPASYIAVGDFNGDGKTDFVISGYEESDVEVFLGNGGGSFNWAGSLADGGDGPGPLVSGNFSGYGRPDLLIGNVFSNDASLLLNNVVSATGTLAGVVLSTQPPPSHNVQCSYSGDGNYAGSTSEAIALIAEPAAAPTFSPAAGTYVWGTTVSITDTTAGATIYYTIDGSLPTSNSIPYTSPFALTTSETLKAIAYATGYFPSSVATAAYTVQVAGPVITPASGTYNTVQTVIISDATNGGAIYYTTDGSTPTASSTLYTAPFAVATSETVTAIAYETGDLPSGIATAAYTLQVATPNILPASGIFNSAQLVTITDTTPGATIYYTTDGSTPNSNSARYNAPFAVAASETVSAIAYVSGFLPSNVATVAYTLPAATPVFTPAGGNFNSVQTVTISDATSGATIYYTTNGSTPTAASARYTSPVSVTTSETFKAIAFATGYLPSGIATAVMHFRRQLQ